MEGVFSIATEEKAHENYILARGEMLEATGGKHESLRGFVVQLEDLMKARSTIFKGKTKLQQEYLAKINKDDMLVKEEEYQYRFLADSFSKAAHRAGSEDTVYCETINQILASDLAGLL